MKQHISVSIITTNKWKYFHLCSQVRDIIIIICPMRAKTCWKKRTFGMHTPTLKGLAYRLLATGKLELPI